MEFFSNFNMPVIRCFASLDDLAFLFSKLDSHLIVMDKNNAMYRNELFFKNDRLTRKVHWISSLGIHQAGERDF